VLRDFNRQTIFKRVLHACVVALFLPKLIQRGTEATPNGNLDGSVETNLKKERDPSIPFITCFLIVLI
jgi:hypothetical protein